MICMIGSMKNNFVDDGDHNGDAFEKIIVANDVSRPVAVSLDYACRINCTAMH